MLVRMQALANARAHLGVTEHPPNSNRGPQVTAWLRRAGVNVPAPWCAAFMWCMFDDAGLKLAYPNKASVGFFEEWARIHGYLAAVPEPGDVVCYRFDADDWPDHTGIVESVDLKRKTVTAVEGNTGIGNDANGGTVMRRTRPWSICKFARVPGDVIDWRPAWAQRAERLEPMWAWFLWKDHGAPTSLRPKHVPRRVPLSWWPRYAVHRGKSK